ncbi:(2Fe-2S) ferredoxin domain-containing protein [Fulvivirga sp. 29W222]|uniref:(2Fe-2S) ferredoxin domain-containing protein n=1 Tax=Fulvivirga marina TaxID=2494733 RepID=A0A937FYL4_9BACT|nr:(2Fe-2S) ferredoxin domain-containing protein [Fulvivirga marina]MBL6447397.1 (2Fe-2S) ferredoxin domain-containing protein [Fulvivirga marina]
MENTKSTQYIFVCSAKDCKKNGSKRLEKLLSGKVKNSNLKSSVEVIKTKCMGHCKKGPNVILNNSLHHKVKENDLDSLLAQCKAADTLKG